MKFYVSFFLLALTLGINASAIEESAVLPSEIGKIKWTKNPTEVPAEWKDKCHIKDAPKSLRNKFENSADKKKQCWCYQSWKGDESDRKFFCCTNCHFPPGCFPPSAKVLSKAGLEISMDNLRTGSSVMAQNEHGQLVESQILGFMDRKPQQVAEFLTLETASGKMLSLTASHIVYRSEESYADPDPVYAKEVSLGQFIHEISPNGSRLTPSEVVNIKTHVERGTYVPLTKEGNLIVDGILVSCYSSYPHDLSHNYLSLARTFPQLISLRFGTQDGCQGPNHDPASEEGCGESLYTSLGKMLSNTFVAKFFESSTSHDTEEPASLLSHLQRFIGVSFNYLS